MNTFIIPHAHNFYTYDCVKIIPNYMIKNYKNIIYVTTLHFPSENILYSNYNKIGNNSFVNYVKFYKFFRNLDLDNDIEKKEHSFLFNLPLLKNIMKKTNKIAVFYVNNNISKTNFLNFVDELNKTFNNKNLYLFTSDLSHLNEHFKKSYDLKKTTTNINSFDLLKNDLNNRECKYIDMLIKKKNIPYDDINKFPGCGKAVLVMTTYLTFKNKGQLLCKTDSQTKYNYIYNINNKHVKNNNKSVVSYVLIGFFPTSKNIISGGGYNENLYNNILEKFNSIFFKSRETGNPLNWNLEDTYNNIVFVTIYDKSNYTLLGCMGSYKGKNLKEKSHNAIHSIVYYDSRFNPNSLINNMSFEITNIFMEKHKKKYSKQQFISQLNILKSNNSYNYSMYIEILDNDNNKIGSAFYIPSVLHEFNNLDKLVSSLEKKANRYNKKKINNNCNYYLIKANNFVDDYYVDVENESYKKKIGGNFKNINLNISFFILITLVIIMIILLIFLLYFIFLKHTFNKSQLN